MFDFLSGDSGLWMLFSTGFISATLLPGSSEVNLIASLKLGDNPIWLILLVATIGNTLGGMTNYWIGRLFPEKTPKNKHVHKAQQWLKKYGYWSLLLSWLPFIGDPLCLAAGWLRMHHWLCLVAILFGKAVRYTTLAIFVQSLG